MTILITVQADAYGTYVNTASLAVVMPADVTPNDNSDSATTIVEPQAPVVDLDPDDNVGVAPNYFATYPENSPPIPSQDADILITDADNTTLVGATIRLTNPLDGLAETLTTDSSGTAISAAYDSGTGLLTLSGEDTLAAYMQVIRNIRYNDTSENPNTATRIIEFIVNDGVRTSDVVTATIRILAINDVSTLTLDADDSGGNAPNFVTSYTEANTPVRIVDDVLISDVDNTSLARITATITNPQDGVSEILSADPGTTGISVLYSGGVLTLAGNAPLSDYQAVLSTLSYSSLSLNPGAAPRIIEIIVNDGGGDSLAVTATVNFTTVNNAPVVNLDADNSGGAAPNFGTRYPQDFTPAILTDGVSVTDPDNMVLTGATVRLLAPDGDGSETLAVSTGASGLSAAFAGDVLTITGSAPPSAFAAVLDSLTYTDSNAALNTPNKAVEITVTDGLLTSTPVTSTVSFGEFINAPLPVGYTCIDFRSGSQGWSDSSSSPTVVWDSNGMYASGGVTPASVTYQLPSFPAAVVLISNEKAAFTVASGDAPDNFTTTLARGTDGAYLSVEPYIQVTWDVPSSGLITSTQLFYYACYQPRPVPDLTLSNLDTTGLVIDYTSLAASGTLAVTVENSVGGVVAAPFSLIFSEDMNANQIYDPGDRSPAW